MTTHAHYSKATIKGHPIHTMLVGFPIAFWTGGFASAIAFASTERLFWLQVSMLLLLAGVIGGVIAALFGAIDLFGGVPRSTRARKTGLAHAGLNVLNLALFAIMGGVMYDRYRTWDGVTHFAMSGPIVLGILGVISLLAAGALGWTLVQTHHVGVDERMGMPEIEPPVQTTTPGGVAPLA